MPPAKAKQFSWTYKKEILPGEKNNLEGWKNIFKNYKGPQMKNAHPDTQTNSENTETWKLMPYGMM